MEGLAHCVLGDDVSLAAVLALSDLVTLHSFFSVYYRIGSHVEFACATLTESFRLISRKTLANSFVNYYSTSLISPS